MARADMLVKLRISCVIIQQIVTLSNKVMMLSMSVIRR